MTQRKQYIFEQVRVRKALQQIPAEQQIVIELAFFGGLTHQEIALHCHYPLGTVKTRLRRGMQRLKPLLRDCGCLYGGNSAINLRRSLLPSRPAEGESLRPDLP